MTATPCYAQLDDPDFHAWFKGSRAAHADGHPILVFRGEHGRRTRRRFQCRHAAISFGDVETAIAYAEDPNDHRDRVASPRVLPAYLDIRKPFVVNTGDPFIDLSKIAAALGRDEAVRLAIKFEDDIRNTGHWMENVEADSVEEFLKTSPERLGELYFLIHRYLDDAEEVARLKAAGFDGAIHCGFGDNATDPEYKVFDEGQVAPAGPWMSPGEAREFAAEWHARRIPAPMRAGP